MALCMMAALMALQLGADAPGGVYFQAHRGGVDEVPENTLAAFEHAWSIPGAVPEMDLVTTRDGVIVCMHDDTPERTTDAPVPWTGKRLKEAPLEEVRKWDAGKKFSAAYAGAKVPLLDEVFAAMKGRPERQAYLDLKDVDLKALCAKIHEHGLERQIIFVHGSPKYCEKLHALYDGARTMTWLSGKPDAVKARYKALAAARFPGLTQLQFHLAVRATEPEIAYEPDDAFLAEAARTMREAGVELQVRPFAFTPASLRRLIDLGVHWYVTDAPKAFSESVAAAVALPGKP